MISYAIEAVNLGKALTHNSLLNDEQTCNIEQYIDTFETDLLPINTILDIE